MHPLQQIIENAWDDRNLLQEEITLKAINEVITLLDAGKLRVEGKEYVVADGDVMHFRFNV